MAVKETSRFCRTCGGYRLAKRETPNHILHLLLTVFTGGFWLIIWAGTGLNARSNTWYCSHCGRDTDVAHISASAEGGEGHMMWFVPLLAWVYVKVQQAATMEQMIKFIIPFAAALLAIGGLALLSAGDTSMGPGPMVMVFLGFSALAILARRNWVRKREEAERRRTEALLYEDSNRGRDEE